MTSKERVLTTVSHIEPDRMPIDFGATMETTIHIQAYENLKQKLDIAVDKPIREKLKTAQFTDVDVEIQEYLDADARGVNPRPSENHKIIMSEQGEYEVFADEFGIIWRRSLDGGLYYDMFKHPLSTADIDEMERYPFPNPRDESRFAGLDEKISTLSEDGRYPIVFDNCFGNGTFQMCNHLMGYDNFLVSLAYGEKRAEYLMNKVLDMKMEFWDEVLTRFGDKIDIVKELDDLGTQAALMISPDMYENTFKPRLSELAAFIKSKAPHVKMMMHSCGSIRPVIPMLIDAGVEILNPVQYTADNMNPQNLKNEFGKDITFWGGGMDTQNILKNGSIDEIVSETRRMMDIFMPGGGFVFAPVHSLQADIPIENMLVMWKTAREFGAY